VIFRFGDHFDIERGELRRGTKPVALEPQVFDLLALSECNPGRAEYLACRVDPVIVLAVWEDGQLGSPTPPNSLCAAFPVRIAAAPTARILCSAQFLGRMQGF